MRAASQVALALRPSTACMPTSTWDRSAMGSGIFTFVGDPATNEMALFRER